MSPDNLDEKTSNVFRYLRERIPNFYIDEKMQEALSFRERLEIFCKNSFSAKAESVGKYFISVESIGPLSQDFFVHIFLSMRVTGCPIVSKVTSSATKGLHCLDEKKHESSGTSTSFCEKNVYAGNGINGYFFKAMEKSSVDERSKETCVPYCGTTFMSDGCSVILMRYLAMTDFCGSLSFDCITMQGMIVQCVYDCSIATMQMSDEVKVLEITQTFFTDGIANGTIKTVLSKQGNILSIDVANSPYIIKINSCVDHCIHHLNPIVLPLKEEWKEDFELTAEYFDKKLLGENRKKKYLQLHFEIIELLSDYIQSLLCKKPEDVIKYTMDYFKTLISNKIDEI